MNTIELLKELTSEIGVSGNEESISSYLKDKLSEYGKTEIDAFNNVKCTFGEGIHFLLDAHLDEIGLIVKAITEDGFIKVDKCGGIDCRMLLASEVRVWGKKEVRGVISTLPPHLQKDEDEKKVPEIDEIAIDIGMSKAEAENVISLGDRVTFKRNFIYLLNGQVSSGVLDDRCGIAAILLALEELKGVNAKITVLFSSQEELGTRGAKTGAYDVNPDEAICIDVSFGYTPFCKKSDCGELGKGPMIGISPILSKDMSESLEKTAKDNSVPYQLEIMGGRGTGTNADVITVTQSGIKTALISIPEKYMHSPIEIVDINDVENTAHLIAEYIKKRAGELNA
ncbi:MAG: M42 family metallopeptidase [Eubacterium sp.]|nr:M42 family metallopeptidase [Eubacterium sp.]